MTCGLSTHGPLLGSVATHHVCGLASPAAAVAAELPSPGDEFFPIKPKVFAQLDVRHSVRAGSFVEPALRHADKRRGLVDRQPSCVLRHDGAVGESFGGRRSRNRATTACVTVSANCRSSGVWFTTST